MSATKEKKSKIQGTPDAANGKLKGKVYERELSKLHVELVKLQQWVVHKGSRPGASRPASTMSARSGNCRRWI